MGPAMAGIWLTYAAYNADDGRIETAFFHHDVVIDDG
jgi:hypothetical protein